jgi:hypothetical protein
LDFRSNGLYVVKADLTTFHRLANLHGGTIELQLDLQLLEPIYLRDQACPYFFNGAVEIVQFGALLLKITRSLANIRGASDASSSIRRARGRAAADAEGFAAARYRRRRPHHDGTVRSTGQRGGR